MIFQAKTQAKFFLLNWTPAASVTTVMPTPPVLENPEHQTKWYSRYFLGKFHRNYVGQDATDAKSIYALSGKYI